MTRYEPTLIVERLRIERENVEVYDERFHSGVNVIYGANSSGKSTILNFIFYGLGGDLFDWSAAAMRCTRVLIQVRINGNVATFSRLISDSPRQPMDLHAGDIESALTAPLSDWLRFSYNRSDTKESFSQVIFRLMNVPEVASDTTGNITINQLLRLLYSDQLSPVESLFKYQGAFDDATLRETVGRLLFGAHSAQYYENLQEIRRLAKELDQLTGEYRSLLSVAGDVSEGFTYEWVRLERQKIQTEIESVSSEIKISELSTLMGGSEDTITLDSQNRAYTEVIQLQRQLGLVREERDNLSMKIADSDRFLQSLKAKLEALQDSSRVADVIPEVRFNECPACNAPLEDPTPHSCYLCKSPYDGGEERGRIIALINETALQIDQSEMLQKSRIEKAEGLDVAIAALIHQWQGKSRELAALRESANTDAQRRLQELSQRLGYLNRQLDDIMRMEQLAKRLQDLSDKRADTRGKISALEGNNEALEREQMDRVSKASTSVSDEIKTLLVNDLRRQDIFENPQNVAFSFRDNFISVNEERYFSASSRAILKSSFILGMLAAATKLPFMRHPRFCMIDSLENMGVEAIRSANFQRQILRVSQESKVEHQIIFATAMIAPELDKPEFHVGRSYTRDEPSLALIP